MAVIGLDIGTSSVKGLLINNDKKIITSTQSYPYEILNDNWTQQNPDDWFDKSLIVLQDLINKTDEDITDISFSGQMHGLVLLDKNDNIIRPAILWNDQRTTKEVDEINNHFTISKLRDEVSNIALTGYTLPKLMWIKRNEKENFDKISKIMLPKDYVSYKLSGVFASDVSDLSGTLFLNVKKRKYSDAVLKYAGITKEKLPTVYESQDKIGILKKDIKQRLNITNDVNIIIGGGDQAIGAIGTGTIKPNQVNLSLGTSGVVFVPEKDYRLSSNPINHQFCDANNKYHKMGVALNTGASIKWIYEDILKNSDYSTLSDDLSKTKFNDIIFLPYLNGERSPINDPYATGLLNNLKINTSQDDIVRAVIEGTCFSLKDIFNELEISDVSNLRVTGGGAKNDFWVQTIANVFNLDVETINIEEGPALGAALIAMANYQQKDLEEIIPEFVKVKNVIKPQSELVNSYENKFLKYKEVYQLNKKIK